MKKSSCREPLGYKIDAKKLLASEKPMKQWFQITVHPKVKIMVKS